jgi:tetratricopeptide (TPR) repeat protein
VVRQADPDPWRDGVRDPAAWDDVNVLAQRVRQGHTAQQSPQLLAALGWRLRGPDAVELLKEAWERHPGDFWVNFALGYASHQVKKPEEAVGYYRAALALRPGTAPVHTNLGIALYEQHKVEEAIAAFRRAIELDPKVAQAHYNLGTALADQHKVEEAIAAYRKAIELDPKYALAHTNLGFALRGQHKFEEAIAAFRKALELDPKVATPHIGLGLALHDQGKLDEAIAAFRKALELDPKDAKPHTNLGIALYEQHRVGEAIASFRKAIKLDPKVAPVHYNLGLALSEQHRVEEAIAAFRKALELDPKLATAHGALGQMLLQQGNVTEARQATRRCLDLLPLGHPLRPVASQLLRQCEEMLALEQKLAAVLQGEVRPTDAAEQVGLAGLCVTKKRYTDATRFFADAFKAQPKLADDLQAGYRYDAACSAALAAAGQGEDAARLDDKERARLRQQALGWLRADLALWGKQAEGGTPQTRALVQKTLRHWQEDADLAGLRDTAALARLPEAERAEWQKLWAEVEALRRKAGKGDKP